MICSFRIRRTVALAVALAAPLAAQPTLSDPALQLELVVSGLSTPTTIAFLGANEFLVLEKNTGWVRRVLHGAIVSPDPVLVLPVETESERGLLGIAIDLSTNPDRVFIYYTRDQNNDGQPEVNRIARFDWNPATGLLQNETVVLDLPGGPGPNHDGGVLLLDSAGRLYAMIGDLNRTGQLQNRHLEEPPDNTGVILRLNQDGSAASGNPFTGATVGRYYAYGIRNGFGLTIDPANGVVWDTENGPGDYDEVNRIDPGFNGGWLDFMGPKNNDGDPQDDPRGGEDGTLFALTNSNYSDPEFSWLDTNAPTGIVFPFGTSLPAAYDQVALVGDANRGQIYRFPLNAGRTGFDFSAVPALQDLVAANNTEADLVRIGTGFVSISDLERGLDGHVYVVSIGLGRVYRIRGAPVASAFHTVTPCRVLDTRDLGQPLISGVPRVIPVAGICEVPGGVPTSVTAVSLNIAVVQGANFGNVTIYAGDLGQPGTGTINVAPGVTRANNATIGLATNGDGTIAALATLAGGGTVHLVVDVNGYYE